MEIIIWIIFLGILNLIFVIGKHSILGALLFSGVVIILLKVYIDSQTKRYNQALAKKLDADLNYQRAIVSARTPILTTLPIPSESSANDYQNTPKLALSLIDGV